jgi:DNA polymerase sigma
MQFTADEEENEQDAGVCEERSAFKKPSVGCLLLHFLRFYGRTFNPATHGIDVTRSTSDTPVFPLRPTHQGFALVVVDPLDTSKNVARSAFNFRNIQWVFSQCLHTLETTGCIVANREAQADVLKYLLRY